MELKDGCSIISNSVQLMTQDNQICFYAPEFGTHYTNGTLVQPVFKLPFADVIQLFNQAGFKVVPQKSSDPRTPVSSPIEQDTMNFGVIEESPTGLQPGVLHAIGAMPKHGADKINPLTYGVSSVGEWFDTRFSIDRWRTMWTYGRDIGMVGDNRASISHEGFKVPNE